jgi:hypothetical protein
LFNALHDICLLILHPSGKWNSVDLPPEIDWGRLLRSLQAYESLCGTSLYSQIIQSAYLHICLKVYTTPGSIPILILMSSNPINYFLSVTLSIQLCQETVDYKAYALTIGTIMTTSKTQIPIPIMIRIRISFHLPISPTLGSAEKGHTTSAYEHGLLLVGILVLIPRDYLPVSSNSENGVGWIYQSCLVVHLAFHPFRRLL